MKLEYTNERLFLRSIFSRQDANVFKLISRKIIDTLEDNFRSVFIVRSPLNVKHHDPF